MGRNKKYFTEEERKAANREKVNRWRERNPDYSSKYYLKNKDRITECQAEYRQANKEKIAEYNADYYQNNKEKIAEQKAEYQSTPKGRAVNLVGTYKQEDKKYNRGECTLTADWIVEHIFNQPCHYCGETDWHELGCDRVDNSLPHTPDNCIPCCCKCNKKKARYSYEEYIEKIKLLLPI